MTLSKSARLDLILAALELGDLCSTRAEVLALFATIVNSVEDAHFGVSKHSNASAQGGRIYPPDAAFIVSGSNPPVYRQRGHRTTIGDNGSFRIERLEANLSWSLVLEKRGADGRGFWE